MSSQCLASFATEKKREEDDDRIFVFFQRLQFFSPVSFLSLPLVVSVFVSPFDPENEVSFYTTLVCFRKRDNCSILGRCGHCLWGKEKGYDVVSVVQEEKKKTLSFKVVCLFDCPSCVTYPFEGQRIEMVKKRLFYACSPQTGESLPVMYSTPCLCVLFILFLSEELPFISSLESFPLLCCE